MRTLALLAFVVCPYYFAKFAYLVFGVNFSGHVFPLWLIGFMSISVLFALGLFTLDMAEGFLEDMKDSE
jgi:hypothetical protein